MTSPMPLGCSRCLWHLWLVQLLFCLAEKNTRQLLSSMYGMNFIDSLNRPVVPGGKWGTKQGKGGGIGTRFFLPWVLNCWTDRLKRCPFIYGRVGGDNFLNSFDMFWPQDWVQWIRRGATPSFGDTRQESLFGTAVQRRVVDIEGSGHLTVPVLPWWGLGVAIVSTIYISFRFVLKWM